MTTKRKFIVKAEIAFNSPSLDDIYNDVAKLRSVLREVSPAFSDITIFACQEEKAEVVEEKKTKQAKKVKK